MNTTYITKDKLLPIWHIISANGTRTWAFSREVAQYIANLKSKQSK